VDSSRAINRRVCGELTLFDRAGGERHVDPPSTDRVDLQDAIHRPARPAIGLSVRILVGLLGCAFLILAGAPASEGTWIPALVLLGIACLCFAVTVFATGPPTDAGAEWGRVRYDRVQRIQFVAASVGFLGIGVTYLLSYIGVPEHWTSAIRAVGGSLLSIAFLMKFPVAYYRHYVSESDR